MHFQPGGDHVLFSKACQGDRKALETLIEFVGPRLHQRIARLCPDRLRGEIDDIYQETWLLLIKDECRILRRYQPEKGDLGAFLLGVARKVATKRRAGKARSRIFLSKLACRYPVPDLTVNQTIEDLFTRASFAEKRFLRESLLSPPDQETAYSKTNCWQLSHRLLNKLWLLVYGPEIPRPRRNVKQPTSQPRAANPNRSRRPF